MGGIAATDDLVIFGARDALDTSDVFYALDARTGKERWRFAYPASPPPGAEARNGRLDYGNSPRTTPLIVGDRVITSGAFGDVHALDLATGKRQWSLNYQVEFEAPLPTWGFSSCPLLIDDKLVLQPGGPEASLVAVTMADGDSVWEAPGERAGYASPIVMERGGERQIIAVDGDSFGGYSGETGKALWNLVPERPGEFLVPSPVATANGVLFVGEANGLRLHRFEADGALAKTPVAVNDSVLPDTHTPVLLGNWVVVWQGNLAAFNQETLQEVTAIKDVPFANHASLITNGRDRVLGLNDSGDLILAGRVDDQFQLLGSVQLSSESKECYAHPALVGKRLYVRLGKKIACYVLP